MNIGKQIHSLLVGGFLLFVFLPFAVGLLAYILTPDPSLEQWVNLFESAAVPWWVGLAETSPLLLVIVFLLASWVNAGEIL